MGVTERSTVRKAIESQTERHVALAGFAALAPGIIITGDSVSGMPSLPCIALPTSVPTSCVCFGKPPASEIPLAGARSISHWTPQLPSPTVSLNETVLYTAPPSGTSPPVNSWTDCLSLLIKVSYSMPDGAQIVDQLNPSPLSLPSLCRQSANFFPLNRMKLASSCLRDLYSASSSTHETSHVLTSTPRFELGSPQILQYYAFVQVGHGRCAEHGGLRARPWDG
jgi:hypothetical protein